MISHTKIAVLCLSFATCTLSAVLKPRWDFGHVSCAVPKNPKIAPQERWSAAKADEVLDYVANSWNNDPDPATPGGPYLNYIDTMWNLFGKPTADCDQTIGSCDFSSEECVDKYMIKNPNWDSPQHTPGAWAIRQGVSHMHSFYTTLGSVIFPAADLLKQQMAEFTKDFDPATNDLLKTIGLDILKQTFELALGAGIGKILENAADDAGDAVDAIKGWASDLIEFAADKLSPPDPTQEDKQDALAAILTTAVVNFKSTLDSYYTHLLSGVQGALSEFRDQLADGKWLQDHVAEAGSIPGLENSVGSAFAVGLITTIWNMTENIQPMILLENAWCDGGEPTDLMPNDVTHATGSCARPGVTLWLVGFNVGQCWIQSETGKGPLFRQPCTETFQLLPGFDKLENWNLNKDDIIGSVYDTYVANGNKNGGKGNGNFLDGMGSQGLYQIPICEVKSAAAIYKGIDLKPTNSVDLCDYGGWRASKLVG